MGRKLRILRPLLAALLLLVQRPAFVRFSAAAEEASSASGQELPAAYPGAAAGAASATVTGRIVSCSG
jgi:hypothetical protein